MSLLAFQDIWDIWDEAQIAVLAFASKDPEVHETKKAIEFFTHLGNRFNLSHVAQVYKGSIPKTNMEIFDGICHEGGGSCVPVTFFQKCFIHNHLESFPYCQNVFCT